MMKKPFIKLFIILGIITCFTSCTKDTLSKEWYLQGGEIKLILNFEANKLAFYDKDTLIFNANILKIHKDKERQELTLKMGEIGNSFKRKYKDMDQFIIDLYPQSNHQLKVLITQFYNKPYIFNDAPQDTTLNYKEGRLLFKTEIDSFLQDFGGYSNLFSHYAVSITSNTTPTMSSVDIEKAEKMGARIWIRQKYEVPSDFSIRNMYDYTYDLDPSSAYITKNKNNLRFEYEINQANSEISTPLNNSAPIKAILINAGNLNEKSSYKHYNRIKQISFTFADEYFGGLGFTDANYNNVKYTITLPDNPQPSIIVFYKPIPAKVIMANVDSYYLGEENAMALFDLVFFTNN